MCFSSPLCHSLWCSPQALLLWSKEVATGDLAFAKGLLHSVMGGGMESPQDTRRNRRSVDADGPQNLEEDLYDENKLYTHYIHIYTHM